MARQTKQLPSSLLLFGCPDDIPQIIDALMLLSDAEYQDVVENICMLHDVMKSVDILRKQAK